MKLTSFLCCVSFSSDISDSETATSKTTRSTAAPKAKPAMDYSQPQPYTPAGASALFAQYVDEDDADVIGPEGLEKLCSDASISLEGALPLILAWQLGASEMAKVKKSEWEKGTDVLRCVATSFGLSLC